MESGDSDVSGRQDNGLDENGGGGGGSSSNRFQNGAWEDVFDQVLDDLSEKRLR
jgi:hypothetical protein